MRRAYPALLRLYPEEYRKLFEGEMLALFEEAAAEQCGRGRIAFFWFCVRELAGLARGGGFEWIAKRGRPDRYLDCLPSAADRIDFLIRRMEYAIAHHEFEKARYYAEEERRERERICWLREKFD